MRCDTLAETGPAAGIWEKYGILKSYLAGLGGVAVAFSGGVDSTLLLKAAHDALGDRALAVTARSVFFPARETDEAAAFCETEGIRQLYVEHDVLADDAVAQNPKDRCYMCKGALLAQVRRVAADNGIEHVAEGSNVDDGDFYRPGFQAVREQGVLSPLRSAGLVKREIRELSKALALPTWDKQSFACLASRVPYGVRLTKGLLARINAAEQVLLDMGLRQLRVRHHGDLARIETDEAGYALLADRARRERVAAELRGLGYSYAAVDLIGYRFGSQDEV